MSHPQSSSMTPNATDSKHHAECGSPDRGVRERVIKEVGLTSTSFIGPAFPPQTNAVKFDIEDSLSEFYKELKEIESPGGAAPRRRDAGRVQPPPRKGTQDVLEEKNVKTRSFDEADGFQKRTEWKHPRPHWYENEPYPRRRPCPELNSGYDVSEQKQWSYVQPVKEPPNVRLPRPEFLRQAPSPAFRNPQKPAAHMDPSFHRPGLTSRSQDPSNFPSFPGCPPPDVSWDFYGESPGFMDRRGRGSDSHPDNTSVGWSRQRREDEGYHHIQRFDSLDDVWERRHHPQTRGHAHSYHSAPVLILMRGLPGSGKSTRARELLSSGPSGIILSTDDYFAHSDGYHYEPGLLGAAHEWNQHRAKEALHDGRSPVIIDNTNLQSWEMKPYVKMALERGYRVDFCEPETSWKFDAYELERRNKHGVPQEKIQQMLDRFSSRISVDAVLNSREPPHVQQRHRAERPPTTSNKHEPAGISQPNTLS